MAEERNRLDGLLNQYTPPNPGKPRATPQPAAERPDTTAPDTSAGSRPPDRPVEPDRPAGTEPAGTGRGEEKPAPHIHPAAQPWDFDTFAEGFARVTADLQRRASELTTALEEASQRVHEVDAADGAVRVTVDGRPRVCSLYVGAKAVRLGPEALAATVQQAVNQALRVARAGAQDALLDRLDAGMRDVVVGGAQEGAEAARRSEVD